MNIENLIDIESFKSQVDSFGMGAPFDHCIIDNFFLPDVAKLLEKEFPDYDNDSLHLYSNSLERKKTSNNWNLFPPLTYKVFSFLNSKIFIDFLSTYISNKSQLYSDPGLNGGGWHMHKKGGKLNTHLDYSIHPKLGFQRKLNIIIYLNSAWKSEWGGELGLWGGENETTPGELVKSINPNFNRAVIFDTTQNSWHGLPTPLRCPDNQYRKSIAVYYLCAPDDKATLRGKALFVPTKEQEGDLNILSLIKSRSKIETAASVYKNLKIKK